MKAVLPLLLQLAALTSVGAGCTIDFNEDISCETAANCPVGFGCDLTVARCVADPNGLLVQDTGTAEDTIDRSDLGGDTADTTVDSGSGDASDTSVSDGSGSDTTTDTEPTCVPSTEVCDGLDNDCDGAPDNGIFCNGCEPGMARIERAGATAFCVDLHEASRQDATADAVGSDSSLATSRAGVQPWKGATFATAGDACSAVGKRLCTDGEWVAACQGAEARLYPYAQLYAPTTCHGINAPPTSGPVATGQFAACLSQDGLFDMSGNLEEWSADRRVRGGAFNDVQNNLKCTSADATVNPTLAQDSVGFRCCDDLL